MRGCCFKKKDNNSIFTNLVGALWPVNLYLKPAIESMIMECHLLEKDSMGKSEFYMSDVDIH